MLVLHTSWPVCRGWSVSYYNSMNNNENNNLKNIRQSWSSCSVYLQDIASHASSISDLKQLCGNRSTKYIYNCKSKWVKLKMFFLRKISFFVLHPNEVLIVFYHLSLWQLHKRRQPYFVWIYKISFKLTRISQIHVHKLITAVS